MIRKENTLNPKISNSHEAGKEAESITLSTDCQISPIFKEKPEKAIVNTFDDSDIYVFSSDWHLRPNHGKGLVYRFSPDESAMVMLHAEEGVALAFLDGYTNLGELVDYLQRALSIEEERAREIVGGLVEKSRNEGCFLVTLEEAKGEFTRINARRLFQELTSHVPRKLSALRLEAPLSLTILPTFLCQTDCIYCYSERPEARQTIHLDAERWESIFIEAGELGIDLITFSGGDPLIFPHIDRILEVAKQYKMAYILPTKSLVTMERAERLAEIISPFGQIQVSVDSFDKEIAAAMTGCKDYAERARTSIRNLRAAGLAVRTNTVVTPLNFSTVESLIRELHELGVERAHITNYWRTFYRHSNDLFLTSEQIDQLNDTVKRLRRSLQWKKLLCNAGPRDFSIPGANSREAWLERSSCSGGFSSLTILPDGKVVLCEQVPGTEEFIVGDAGKQSLTDIWESQALIDFIVPDKERFGDQPCAECEEFDSCHRYYGRCFRDAYFNFGTPWAPSPNCPQAPSGLRWA
jgi:radical SAM protein with 4Fe4S-binding SPASM domain